MPENAQDMHSGIGQALADASMSEIRLHIDVIDNSIGLTGEYVHGSGASAHLGGPFQLKLKASLE
jgi:hypothetical protein